MLNRAVADVWKKICSVDLKIQKFKRLSPLLIFYSTNVKESHWMGCEHVIKKLLRQTHEELNEYCTLKSLHHQFLVLEKLIKSLCKDYTSYS